MIFGWLRAKLKRETNLVPKPHRALLVAMNVRFDAAACLIRWPDLPIDKKTRDGAVPDLLHSRGRISRWVQPRRSCNRPPT